MKNIILLFVALFVLQSSLFSQKVIEVSYALDRQGNYIFSCMNRAWCDYVVTVEFTTLENAKSDHSLPYEAEVRPGLNKLFTVSPDKGKDIQLKYGSSYRKGCLHPIVNPDFTYLLPIAPGKEAQVYEVWNTRGNGAGAAAGEDSSFTIRLKMKPGDTIYSARRGMVTAVDVSNTENDAGIATTGSWNYIEIVHGDCSFGQYGVLKKDGAFVKPGQMVEAGIPIGLVGGDRYGRGSDVRFSVSYTGGQLNTSFPLQFWTKKNGKGRLKHGGTYISEHPQSLVTAEMSKPKPPLKKGKGKAKA